MELIWAELGAEGAWVGLGLAADVEQEGGAGEAEEPEAEAHRGVPAHPSRFQCWMEKKRDRMEHTPALCSPRGDGKCFAHTQWSQLTLPARV